MTYRHKFTLIVTILALFLMGGCATKVLPPILVPTPDHYIDYLSEVKPILDNRCVVCHSCYIVFKKKILG